MKWSLFNWKKPVVSSGEPEDYQVVKNTVSQNERNITNINSQITNVNNQLNNTVSTNTAQTITGAKTFNEGITINKNPVPLLLKATSSEKNYVVFRDSANNSNLSIGANATSSSLEVNRGNLEIQTQQDNKTISFNTGRVKFNRSVVEFGTEINAGYGGGTVKFIPEDNSTKTLQFFNNNANDARRFKLAVPEPVDNNNPATKNYVDTKETAINNQINTLNTFKTTTETNISDINSQITNVNNNITNLNNSLVANNTILKRRYQFTSQSSTPTQIGEIYRYILNVSDLPGINGTIISVSANYGDDFMGRYRANYWNVSFTTSSYQTFIQLTGDKTFYDNYKTQQRINFDIDFSIFWIDVFYMLSDTNREAETIYQGQVLSLEEVFGGNNEN